MITHTHAPNTWTLSLSLSLSPHFPFIVHVIDIEKYKKEIVVNKKNNIKLIKSSCFVFVFTFISLELHTYNTRQAERDDS